MRQAALILIVVLAACGGGATSTTLGCTPAEEGVATQIGVEGPLVMVPTGGADDPWVVADYRGAAWLVLDDPTDGEINGALPLNEEARTASTIGVDVEPDAPIFGGITEEHPAVTAALNCSE